MVRAVVSYTIPNLYVTLYTFMIEFLSSLSGLNLTLSATRKNLQGQEVICKNKYVAKIKLL